MKPWQSQTYPMSHNVYGHVLPPTSKYFSTEIPEGRHQIMCQSSTEVTYSQQTKQTKILKIQLATNSE